MSIEQLAKATRHIFECHHDKLNEGLPFFSTFPLNCCQGASIVFGLFVTQLYPQLNVTVIRGSTRNREASHYWLEIDRRVYDVTLDQFSNQFAEMNTPLFGSVKHPLRTYFFYKERMSIIEAFSIFISKHANLKDVEASLQFIRRELVNRIVR